MDLATVAQIVPAVAQIVFAAVVGAGYYLLIRVSRETLQEMRAARLAGGDPRSSSRRTTRVSPWSTSWSATSAGVQREA